MTLVLEIEHLTGVAFAAVGPDSDEPGWPPQPDRIFSALVATWAAHGEPEPETRALEWLEQQPVPLILASEATVRSAPVSFVPPNDPETGRSGDRSVMPAFRRRQPRRFPAARPHDPVVRLMWPDLQPEPDTFAALERLAVDTAYVGHSASLTRCCFRAGLPEGDLPVPRTPTRRIYARRLDELRRAFESGRRPLPGEPVRGQVEPKEAPQQSSFGREWLILEDISEDIETSGGTEPPHMPDIRACAMVAKAIRDCLLDGYGRAGLDDKIPLVVSGHQHDGSPARDPHLAIIPLAFAGFPYADGRVLGFALVPPRDSDILRQTGFRQALRKLAPLDDKITGEQQRRVLRVSPKRGSRQPHFSVALSPTFEPPGRRSLDPTIYTQPARTFATVTPIVLDRHLKENGEAREEEIIEQIVAACRNIGLDEPELVVPDKHSALEGAPSARPSGKSPQWMRWRLPASLASRALTHAVIRFPREVEGPVILGAGRFVGLGLCRPVDEREDRR